MAVKSTDGIFYSVDEKVIKDFSLYLHHNQNNIMVFDTLDSIRRDADKQSKLAIHINSYGGHTDEVNIFDNFIHMYFKRRTTTFIESSALSAGAMIFLLGDRRYITPDSQFMLHKAVYMAFGKDVYDRAKHQKRKEKEWFKRKVVDTGYITKDEFKKIENGKDLWFSPKKMCKRGIATHVFVNGVTYTAKEALKQKLV